jgi:hypothetical protein
MSAQPSPSAGGLPAGGQQHSGFRWALAGVSAAVAVGVIGYSAFLYASFYREYITGNGQTPTLKRTDLTKMYLDLKQEQVKTVGQTVFLVAAAVWGLLIAKSGETRILLNDWPEISMFISFNLIVLACLGFIYLGTQAMVSGLYTLVKNQAALNKELVPDFHDTSIEALNDFTVWLLVAALAVAAMTFFSAHRLKRGE